MVSIESYTAELQKVLQGIFGSRLLYLGLQGSYMRQEQNEDSDIDIMAVLDGLTPEDLSAYKDALIQVGSYEKSCGFICGKEDLLHWNPLELCHLLHATKDICGTLKELLPAYTREDVKNFIKLGAGNLYHEICHRSIHAEEEKNKARLPGSYKSVFFILQNLCFLEQGVFYNSKAELLCHLKGEDKEVLAMALCLQKGGSWDFENAFNLLFSWCRNTMRKADEI